MDLQEDLFAKFSSSYHEQEKYLKNKHETERIHQSRQDQKCYPLPSYVKQISKMTSDMWIMRGDGVLCDLDFVVGGETISCHKNILAVSSQYFARMFEFNYQENRQGDDGKSKVMVDQDGEMGLNGSVVLDVLFYIYTGVLPHNVDITNVPDIFTLSHLWLLNELQDICENLMVRDIGSGNFQQFLVFAEKFHLKKLKDTAIFYIRRNLPAIYKTDEFLLLKPEIIHKALNDPIVVCHESLVWLDAICHWAHGCGEMITKALEHIPVEYIIQEDLTDLLCDPRLQKFDIFREKIGLICGKNCDNLPSNVKYFARRTFDIISMEHSHFHLNTDFSPGLFLHYKAKEVVLEEVKIELEPLKRLVKKTIKDFEGASQVLYKNRIYFMFDNRCNQKKHSEHWNQPIYIFCFMKKIWTKFDCPLSFILPSIDVQCNCQPGGTIDFKKMLHLEGTTMYYLIGTPAMKILLKTDLDLDKPDWKVVFCFQGHPGPLMHEQIEGEGGQLVSRPNWRDVVEILKVDNDKIYFITKEELERFFQFYTISFTNESSLSDQMIGPECSQLATIAIDEERTKYAVMTTRNQMSTSNVDIVDITNVAPVSIKKNLKVEVVSIDKSNDCLYILAKKKDIWQTRESIIVSYMYDLIKEEWKEIKCTNKKGGKLSVPELEESLCHPGFIVPCQLLYNDKLTPDESDDSDDDVEDPGLFMSTSRFGMRMAKRFRKAKNHLKKLMTETPEPFL